MKLKKIGALAVFLMAGAAVYAQSVNLPTVEMQGGRYYSYEIEASDSAYGIAKKFGWDYDTLCKLNPQVVKNMKKGALIYYPVGEVSAETVVIPDVTGETKIVSHVVRKGDTVYSIAAKYGIPIESIYEAYPSARDGIKEGETLVIDRIAQAKTKSEVAVSSADNQSVKPANQTDKPSESLPEIKVPTESVQNVPQASNSSQSDKVPVENEAIVDVTDILSDVDSTDININKISNIAIVLDAPSLSRDREFMRGFLIGLKQIQKSGLKSKLTAIDATKGEASVLSALDALSPDVVVLTHEKDIPDWIIKYGNQHSLPVVNVFDVKYTGAETNPSVVQILTPSDDFNKHIAEYALNNFEDTKLVFIGAPAPNDGIATELKRIWPATNLAEILPTNILEKGLRDDAKYIFYVNETKKDNVQSQLEQICKLKEQYPLANVKVFGRASWVTLVSAFKDLFAKTDIYIPSRFYFDWNSPVSAEFLQEYEATYHRRPAVSYPIYAVAGYDVSQCLIPSIAANNGDFSKGLLRGNTLQSDFILDKDNDNGGYVNQAVYLVRFTPFGTIEKIIAE